MNKIITFDKLFWISLTIFILFVLIVCTFPLLFTRPITGYDFTATGQVGDTIGGIMGPFIAIGASILTFLAFWVQYKANEQQKSDIRDQRNRADLDGFENTFFEMINLHRQNVTDLNYSYFENNNFENASARKVMRVIFHEFITCYREVKKFSNSTNPKDYLNPRYQIKLEDILSKNKIKTDIIELAIIDIAYSIVFFGVGVEGETILRDRFKEKYNNSYYFRLLAYIKLKPKKQNYKRFEYWEKARSLVLKDLTALVEEIYLNRNSLKSQKSLSEQAKNLIGNDYVKFYGGHQHRLGHYFRHLFQTYKFLNQNTFLTMPQKYFYGKTLRAQLSTYEQALLFINSISSIGMRWEFKFHLDQNSNSKNEEDIGLITKYHLIKNLPGNHFFGITYKDYYPRVKYENRES